MLMYQRLIYMYSVYVMLEAVKKMLLGRYLPS